MPTQRFLIGFNNDQSGLQTNYKPWLIADNAFSLLKNAYVFRGRLRKRFGSTLMGPTQLNSRLRMELTPAALVVTTPINLAIGQQFSIGSDIFTVQTITVGQFLLTTSAVTAQVTAVNQVTFSAIASTVYFYPALPVMGITQYETGNINDEPTIAWDTRFAYQFDESINAWVRIAGGTSTWTGTNSDFFWATNYYGTTEDINLLWATNYVVADRIRYWDNAASPTTPATGTWAIPANNFKYGAGTNDIVQTARIVLPFKNRLILLNTVEGAAPGNTFAQRCRYSGAESPLATNAWRQDIPGNGNFVDAATQEAIITAQFIKDRLIVYFERSTWELVYTGNQVFPFVWQKINTELGAESTFSQVPFDKAVLGIGNVGIHACSGTSVERIDAKIPELVFQIHNEAAGIQRVAGIRDYNSELVYWAFPFRRRSTGFPFPNQVLVYNYTNNSWALNDDSFTAFGFWQTNDSTPEITWAEATSTWQSTNSAWGSAANVVKFRTVVAGNQEGYVVRLDRDITRNSPSLQVTNFTPATGVADIIDHNLNLNDYVLLENMNGLTFTDSNGDVLTSVIGQVNVDPILANTPNAVTLSIDATITGTYRGGGTAARISKIDILTKEYNFFTQEDRNAYIPKVDFLVDRTDNGEVTVDYFVSTSLQNIVSDGSTTGTGALLGSSILQTSPYSEALIPLEETQTRLWHPLYFSAEGECVQLKIYFNDAQMKAYTFTSDGIIYPQLEDFQLHAMNFYAIPTSSRMQ